MKSIKFERNNAVGPQMRSRKRAGRDMAAPVLAITAFVVAFQFATQDFARQFDYHASLGAHLSQWYAPWKILGWRGQYGSQYPNELARSLNIGVIAAAVGLLIAAAVGALRANTAKPNPFLHGSARWAERQDIEEAGLLPRSVSLWQRLMGGAVRTEGPAVYVGAWVDKAGKTQYLRHTGPEHVLTYAPTGSGKTVGLVLPTLLSWPESALITDLKGELYAQTAGWRQKHARNKVLRFEPASRDGGVRWNPLDEVRFGTDKEVGDCQNLATLIVDPDGKGLNNHWQKTSQALLAGMILHALYKAHNEGETATLPSIDAMLADPNRPVGELWMEMAHYSHVNGAPHPLAAAAGRDMMDRPEEEAGSVLSTAKSYLSLFRDPVVAHNVSGSDFSINDLMNHADPVSLYIVTTPVDKARLRPLVRILVNMVVRLLADKLEFEHKVQEPTGFVDKLLTKFGLGPPPTMRSIAQKPYKHRLLGMIDECASLGRLDILQESLAFLRGYGFKFYLIFQDINQIKSRDEGYGQDETISSACGVQNAMSPNRLETAEHLSRLTGVTTILKEQITTSGKRFGSMQEGMTRTVQEHQRPLLTPDECLRLPGAKKKGDQIIEAGDMVVYVAGFPAIYGQQPLYFKDPTFVARAGIPPPKHSDRLRGFATPTETVTL